MATYYLDYKNGNDMTGNGSSGTPYKTITKGLAVAGNNDTLILRGDIADPDTWYREAAYIISETGLTMTADTGHTPTTVGTHRYTTWAPTGGFPNVYQTAFTAAACWTCWNGTTKLTSKTSIAACNGQTNSFYADLTGDLLYVNIGGAAPTAIEVIDYAGANRVMRVTGANCTISNLSFQYHFFAVQLEAAGITIENCLLRYWHDFSKNGAGSTILVLAAGNVVIDNCDCGGTLAKDHYAITLEGSAEVKNLMLSESAGILVSTIAGTDVIHDCTFIDTATVLADIDCTNAASLTVHHCLFETNAIDVYDFHHYLQFHGTIIPVVHHCLCRKNVEAAEKPYAIVNHGAGSTVYNCTFVNIKSASSGQTIYIGSLNTPPMAYVTVKNCIFYNCKYAYYEALPDATYDLDYNCYYLMTLPPVGPTPGELGTHNVESDPLFVSPGYGGATDYNLQSGSPCRAAGTYIAGVSEYNPATMGRYEYTAGAGAIMDSAIFHSGIFDSVIVR